MRSALATLALLVAAPAVAAPPRLEPGAVIALYSPSHKRFVRLDDKGFANSFQPVAGPDALPGDWTWERFRVVDGGGGTIALYSSVQRRYLRINGNGDADSYTQTDCLPAEWGWERFLPVDAGGGLVALYNPVNKRFLRMKPDGDCDTYQQVSGADALPPSWGWERFQVVVLAPPVRALPPGAEVALFFPEQKRFLRIDEKGAANAYLPVAGPDALPPGWTWEHFRVVDAGCGRVALQSIAFRRFLRMNESGDVDSFQPVDTLPASWDWERFFPVDAGGGLFALYNPVNKRFLRMKPDGDCDSAGPMPGADTLPAAWSWERFRVVPLAHARPTPPPPVAAAAPPPAPAPPTPTAPAAPAPTSDTIAAVARRGSPQPDAFALIVGIERYRDLPPPTGARRDAERLREIARTTLGIPDDHVLLAVDDHATRSDIERDVEWLGRNVRRTSRIYFFYSGHGAPDPSTGASYLVPYDGDPAYLDRTALALPRLLDELAHTGAREVVAFVDACFSGAGGRSVLPRGARPLVAVKKSRVPARVALVTASSGSEVSGPHPDGDGGLFSRELAAGLATAQADGDGDGQISLGELYRWVKPRVVRQAHRDNREQTPALVGGGGVAEETVLTSGLSSE